MLHKVAFVIVIFFKGLFIMGLSLGLMALLVNWLMDWNWPYYAAAIATPIFAVVYVVQEVKKMEMAEFVKCIEKMNTMD